MKIYAHFGFYFLFVSLHITVSLPDRELFALRSKMLKMGFNVMRHGNCCEFLRK